MRKSLILPSILSFLSMFTAATEKDDFFEDWDFVNLASKHTGKTHELFVILPYGYHVKEMQQKSYPVLYFTDGYWDASLLNSIYDHYMYDNNTPEFIMVGLSYAGKNVDKGFERGKDLTPTRVAVRAAESGGAKKYLAHLKTEVIPYIEKNYRVNTEHRALSGSSFGGLFVMYTLYEETNLFDRYIALSPSVDWDDNYIARRDEAFAKKHKELNARLYIAYGEEEYGPYSKPISALQEQIKSRKYKGLTMHTQSFPGLGHASVKSAAYSYGLLWAWEDLAPKSVSGLERDFKAFKATEAKMKEQENNIK